MTAVIHRGHRIVVEPSKLCGFPVFRYEIHEGRALCGYGWAGDTDEQCIAFAKLRVDERLDGDSERESAMEGVQ